MCIEQMLAAFATALCLVGSNASEQPRMVPGVPVSGDTPAPVNIQTTIISQIRAAPSPVTLMTGDKRCVALFRVALDATRSDPMASVITARSARYENHLIPIVVEGESMLGTGNADSVKRDIADFAALYRARLTRTDLSFRKACAADSICAADFDFCRGHAQGLLGDKDADPFAGWPRMNK